MAARTNDQFVTELVAAFEPKGLTSDYGHAM